MISTGNDPHPEVTEIADFSEGLLPPERAAQVREHLDGCAVCADVLASLEEIRALLGTLPDERRMPADIAGRIDAALAAEALLDSIRPDVPRETSTADAGADSGHVSRGTSRSPSGHPSASSGPGRGGPPGSRRSRRGGRALIAGAYAAAVLALGGAVYGVVSAGGGNAANNSSSLDTSTRNGSMSAQESVEGKVHALLAHPSPSGGAGTSTATGGPGRGNTPMLNENTDHPDVAPLQTVVVPSCVLKATQRSQPPLAAEHELYQGASAYLLVLPHPGDPSQVDAFVVNASCTTSSQGAVLFRATYPR